MSGSFSAFVPAGANSNIQFNNNGVFAGSDNLTWNNSTSALSVKGIFNANGMTVFSNTSLAALVANIAGDTSNNFICRQIAASGNVYYGTVNASNTSGFVYFQTAGSNRAFITGAGLFGINTSSPGAQLGIESSSASTIGLIVKGASSQSANLQEWQNSGGVSVCSIQSTGLLRTNSGIRASSYSDNGVGNGMTFDITTNSGGVNILGRDAGANPMLRITPAPGFAANLTEWRNSSGTALSSIRSDGSLKPASIADSSAVNDSIYYSTTQSKLVYKDSSGIVNALY